MQKNVAHAAHTVHSVEQPKMHDCYQRWCNLISLHFLQHIKYIFAYQKKTKKHERLKKIIRREKTPRKKFNHCWGWHSVAWRPCFWFLCALFSFIRLSFLSLTTWRMLLLLLAFIYLRIISIFQQLLNKINRLQLIDEFHGSSSPSVHSENAIFVSLYFHFIFILFDFQEEKKKHPNI